jgi:hypothetical protein
LEGFGIVDRIDSNANDPGTGIGETLTRFSSSFNIGCFRGGHAL